VRLEDFFLGICGAAIGNVTLLARAAGHEVSEADANAYPPMGIVLGYMNGSSDELPLAESFWVTVLYRENGASHAPLGGDPCFPGHI
jgi:hypothetical protein